MYHDSSVYRFVLERIEPDMLQHEAIEATVQQRLVFGILYRHAKEHDSYSIGAETLATYLKEVIDTVVGADPFSTDNGSQLQVEVLNLYRYLVKPLKTEEGVEKAMDYCRKLYEQVAFRPKLERTIEDAMLNGTYDDISQTITETMSIMAGSREPYDPFDMGQTKDSIRISTGEKWMNRLTNGGWQAGLAYGIICPTGGGKTTMATQGAFGIAKEGRPVAVVYTEQTMKEREMVAKYWSLVTGVRSNDYCISDAKKLDELLNNVSLDDRETMKIVRDNLQIYDFSIKSGSMSELRSIAAGRGGKRKPSALFIDWAGEFAKGLMATDPHVKADDETQALQYMADDCARIAREFMIPVIIFHQMGGSYVGGPMKDYNCNTAHRCKNFCFDLAYGIVICPCDENNITRIAVTKGRYSGKGYEIVRLDGDISRFTPMENYIKGPRRYEDQGKRNTMPVEKKRQKGPSDGTDMMDFHG